MNNVVDALSWWPFSDLFEEGGLYPNPYSSEGWLPVAGLMNNYGIPKPSYRAFQLLHWTGNQLLNTTPSFLTYPTVGAFAVTGNNTSIFVVNWNVKNQPINDELIELTVIGVEPSKVDAMIYRIDDEHTYGLPLWEQMGSPLYLTPAQVQKLDAVSELVPEEIGFTITGDDSVMFSFVVPGNSVANIVLLENNRK